MGLKTDKGSLLLWNGPACRTPSFSLWVLLSFFLDCLGLQVPKLQTCRLVLLLRRTSKELWLNLKDTLLWWPSLPINSTLDINIPDSFMWTTLCSADFVCKKTFVIVCTAVCLSLLVETIYKNEHLKLDFNSSSVWIPISAAMRFYRKGRRNEISWTVVFLLWQQDIIKVCVHIRHVHQFSHHTAKQSTKFSNDFLYIW